MSSSQLFLRFNSNNIQVLPEQDFIFCHENQQPCEFLEKFFHQKLSDKNLVQRLIIKGEKFSGKSSLLNIFAKKYSAKFIKATFLEKGGIFEKGKFYILEDIDNIEDDNILFYILNSAYENQSFLVMSAKNIEIFKLKDLVSRLKNIYVCEIKNPEIETITMLIFSSLSKKQLKISSNIIGAMVNKSDRSYESAFKIADKIEKFCFENKRQPSKKDLNLLI